MNSDERRPILRKTVMMFTLRSWNSAIVTCFVAASVIVSCHASSERKVEEPGLFLRAQRAKHNAIGTNGNQVGDKFMLSDYSKDLTNRQLQETSVWLYYVIEHSGKCMQIVGSSLDTSALIEQADCVSGKPSQLFQQVIVPNEGFMLQSSLSSMCVTLPGANLSEGAQLDQWHCVSAANQIFNWVGDSLVFKHSQQCVNVQGDNSIDDGALLVQQACQNDEFETITTTSSVDLPTLAPVPASPTPPIQPGTISQYILQNSGMCMEVPDSDMTKGAKLKQAECVDEAANQMFETMDVAGGGFMLKAVHSGMCITRTTTGIEIVQRTCEGIVYQVLNWVGESIQFSDSLSCISAHFDSTDAGAPIVKQDCKYDSFEAITVSEGLTASSSITILPLVAPTPLPSPTLAPVTSATVSAAPTPPIQRGATSQYNFQFSGKCMQVPDFDMAEQAKLEQADCVTGAANQVFETMDVVGDGFMLRAVHSGLCVSRVPSGIGIVQRTCGSMPYQVLNWVGNSIQFPDSLTCVGTYLGSAAAGAPIVEQDCKYDSSEAMTVVFTIANAVPATPVPVPVIPTPPIQPDAIEAGPIYQYMFKDSGMCMGVMLGLKWTGAWIDATDCDSGGVQQMLETINVDGGFMLKIKYSGLCITGEEQAQQPDQPLAAYQAECISGDNQILNWSGSSLKFQYTGDCISVVQGSLPSTARRQIQQTTCTASASQQFILASAVSHQPFVALHSRKCMDIVGQNVNNGAKVHQLECFSTKPSQQFEEVVSNGGFMIKNQLSGKCVTVPGSSQVDGVQLELYECVGDPNQVFLREAGKLLVKHSDLCVGVEFASNENFAPFVQSICHGFHDQIISYLPYVVEHSNLCLGIPHRGTSNGGTVIQDNCVSGGDSQKLRVIPGSGGFQLKFLHSGKCLSVPDGRAFQNAIVVQWDCIDGAGHQLFNWNGSSLVSRHSGMCLSIFGGMIDHGGVLVQKDCIAGALDAHFSIMKLRPVITFNSIGVIARIVDFDATRFAFSAAMLETTKMNFLHRFPAYVSQLSNGLVAINTTLVVCDSPVGTSLKSSTFHTDLPEGFGAQFGPQGKYDTVHVMAPHPQQQSAAYWAPRVWGGFHITSTANRGIVGSIDEHTIIAQWTHEWLRIVDEYFYQWVHEVDTIDVDSSGDAPIVRMHAPEFKNSEEMLSNLLLGRVPKSAGGFYGLGKEVFSSYGSMEEHLKTTDF